MLGALRRNKNNPIITAVLGLVVLLMMAFGISVQGVTSDGYAAKVNDDTIPDGEFAALYAQVYRNKQYQNRRYDRAAAEAEGLREAVLAELIGYKVMAQNAQRSGLEVDDEALRHAIMNDEQYQTDGVFDREKYERIVNYQGMAEHTWEARQREALLAQPYSTLIGSMGVSEQEIKDSFTWENTKVNVTFIQVPKDKLQADVADVTDADVTAFLAREDADEKIQAYYKKNKSKMFDVPKQVCAQHILVRVDKSTPPDIRIEAETKIAKAAKAVTDGMDFTEAAKKFSEDANSSKGGDLGCFAAAETQPQLAEAAFSLKAGEVSKIVKTPFGFHVLKVNEIKEPVRRKLEDAKQDIARALAKDAKAGSLAKSKAEQVAELAKIKDTLDEVVAELAPSFPFPLKVEETGPFPQGREFLPKLGLAKDVSHAAWALTEDRPVAGPIESDKAWVVIRLKAKEGPKEEDFKNARLGIAYRMISSKQSALRDKWYQALADREEVLIDPIAVRYDEEAENIRSARRQRTR